MTILRRRPGRVVLGRLVVALSVVATVTVGVRIASADTGAACAATYAIGWQTPTNNPPDFGATVTVKNNAPYAITTWTVTWTWGTGQSLVAGSAYSAVVTQNGSAVTATPGGSYNANLAPGASATFGFHGTY